jgi:hypothetical protein
MMTHSICLPCCLIIFTPDVDGCSFPEKCFGNCTKFPGSKYLCQCPEGTIGDPYTPNGCVKPRDSKTGNSSNKIFNSPCLLELISPAYQAWYSIFFSQQNSISQLIGHRNHPANRV